MTSPICSICDHAVPVQGRERRSREPVPATNPVRRLVAIGLLLAGLVAFVLAGTSGDGSTPPSGGPPTWQATLARRAEPVPLVTDGSDVESAAESVTPTAHELIDAAIDG